MQPVRNHPVNEWVIYSISFHPAPTDSLMALLWKMDWLLSQGLVRSPLPRAAGAAPWWMTSDFLYKVILTPPNIPPTCVIRACVCVCVRTASVCLCFPSDMEVAFVCRPNETSPLWQIMVRRDGCLRRLHYSGEWLDGCEGLHSKSATTPWSTWGVRYLRKFLNLLPKLVYLNYIRGCLQFSVILNTECVSQSQARPVKLKHTVGPKFKTWTVSVQHWLKNLPTNRTLNFFIWTQTSFASTWRWNKQNLILYNKQLHISHM